MPSSPARVSQSTLVVKIALWFQLPRMVNRLEMTFYCYSNRDVLRILGFLQVNHVWNCMLYFTPESDVILLPYTHEEKKCLFAP